MFTLTTKLLVLLLFTGTLVSAGGIFSRNKNKENQMKKMKEKEQKGRKQKQMKELQQANKYGALNDTLKDKYGALNDTLKDKQIQYGALNEDLKETEVRKYRTHSEKIKEKEQNKENEQNEKRNNAAVNIQSLTRGKQVRNQVKKLKTNALLKESKKKELKKRNAAENNSKDLKGFYKNQEAHEKKAEQRLAVTENKWVRFNKGRQEKEMNRYKSFDEAHLPEEEDVQHEPEEEFFDAIEE